MEEYTQRVRQSILPLSVGDTLPKAFEEWSFTNNVEDHEDAVETCELCGQEHLRYHFEIKNALTQHRLWVGSHCILRFGLSVFEDGRKLTEQEAKKKVIPPYRTDAANLLHQSTSYSYTKRQKWLFEACVGLL